MYLSIYDGASLIMMYVIRDETIANQQPFVINCLAGNIQHLLCVVLFLAATYCCRLKGQRLLFVSHLVLTPKLRARSFIQNKQTGTTVFPGKPANPQNFANDSAATPPPRLQGSSGCARGGAQGFRGRKPGGGRNWTAVVVVVVVVDLPWLSGEGRGGAAWLSNRGGISSSLGVRLPCHQGAPNHANEFAAGGVSKSPWGHGPYYDTILNPPLRLNEFFSRRVYVQMYLWSESRQPGNPTGVEGGRLSYVHAGVPNTEYELRESRQQA